MSTQTTDEAAWLANPYTYRNNRCLAYRKDGSYIGRCGIPEPKGHERPEDKKGSDRIGFEEVVITSEMVGSKVAVFKGVEIKGYGDRLKPGQISWHNFLLGHGARSEIWKELKSGEIEIIKEAIDESTAKIK